MSVESFVNEAHELHATYKLTKTSTWSSDEKYKHYREIYIKCDKLMDWGGVKMSEEEHKLRSTVLERLSELIEKCLYRKYELIEASTWSSDEKYKHYCEIYIKCDKLMEKWGTTVSDKPLVKMSDEEHKLRSTVLERLSELIEKCLTHKLQ